LKIALTRIQKGFRVLSSQGGIIFLGVMAGPSSVREAAREVVSKDEQRVPSLRISGKRVYEGRFFEKGFCQERHTKEKSAARLLKISDEGSFNVPRRVSRNRCKRGPMGRKCRRLKGCISRGQVVKERLRQQDEEWFFQTPWVLKERALVHLRIVGKQGNTGKRKKEATPRTPRRREKVPLSTSGGRESDLILVGALLGWGRSRQGETRGSRGGGCRRICKRKAEGRRARSRGCSPAVVPREGEMAWQIAGDEKDRRCQQMDERDCILLRVTGGRGVPR